MNMITLSSQNDLTVILQIKPSDKIFECAGLFPNYQNEKMVSIFWLVQTC